MTRGRRRRGSPLLALILVLTSWVSVRATVWREYGSGGPPARVGSLFGLPGATKVAGSALPGTTQAGSFSPWPDVAVGLAPLARIAAQTSRAMTVSAPAAIVRPEAPAASAPGQGWFAYFLPAGSGSGRATTLSGLWRASVAVASANPAALAAPGGNEAPAGPLAAQAVRTASRWSGDTWLLMRRGGDSIAAAGPGIPTYGANQSGAVLRYALSRNDPHRPAAYLRVTSALDGADERELALGLQAQPLAKVPVIALAELRLSREDGKLYPRPAIMGVTQFPPMALPLGTQGDAYLQGGYVAGRYATPFVDGQLRIDRKLIKLGKGELRLGAGSWGGAQKGASRLDIGPEATWRLALNRRVAARLAVDWRFKVAGNAQPTSGPALTLAAGF